MKKGCLIASAVGLFLLLAAGVGVFLVLRLTKPMVDEGERFLAVLGSGSTSAAYGMASSTLRSSQSEEAFAQAVKGFGLDGYQSASWSNRQVQNDRGTLEGTARTKAGGAVPLTLEMIKENGNWKVLSVKGPQAGARTGPVIEKEVEDTEAKPALAVPDSAAAAQLALASLMGFNHAVQQKSFTAFHAGISKAWQEEITPEKLLEVFQPFIDAEIDIALIGKLEPVFASPPAANDDGVLVLEGHYPTTPNKVYFKLKYIDEDGVWRLFGINVNVNE